MNYKNTPEVTRDKPHQCMLCEEFIIEDMWCEVGGKPIIDPYEPLKCRGFRAI